MKARKCKNKVVLYNTVELRPLHNTHLSDRLRITFEPAAIIIEAAIDGAGNRFRLTYGQLAKFVQP